MVRPFLWVLALCAGVASAQAPQNEAFERARATRTANASKILRLIAELGHDDFATREAAREGLREIGGEALPYLERAQLDPDAERAMAARELARELRWRVDPGLRDLVGDALDAWPDLPPQERLRGIALLGERGGTRGVAFLVRVARYDPDAVLRLAAIDAYLAAAPQPTPHDASLLQVLEDEAPAPQVAWLRSRLLRRAGQHEAGLACALEAARADPQAPPARLLELIDLLLEAERLADARPFAEALAERLPDDPGAAIRLGELRVREGDSEAGLALLERVAVAVEAGQVSAATLIRLGRAYLACGQADAGDTLYRKALGRNPYRHDLILARGDLCRDRGQVDEALAIYLSEIRYSAPGEPDYDVLCQRLGELLARRGAPGVLGDAAFFRDAQRGRALRTVHATVATWLLDHGLLPEAIEELRLVAALDPNPGVLRALGDALRDAGDYAGAREAYGRALARSPDSLALEARLAAVAGDAPQIAAEDSAAGAFRLWERRLPGDGASVAEGAPPPLLIAGQVVACLPGSTTLQGLSAQQGESTWSFTPPTPQGPEGALPEQLGWEPVALYRAPAGVVAAQDPGRARETTPVVGALYNAFWRPLNRSWRKAKFLGVTLFLVDPHDGRLIASHTLPDAEQVLAAAAEPHGAHQLLLTAESSRRSSCELLDATLGRARWRARLGSRSVRALAHLGSRLFARHSGGLLALRPDGSSEWSHAAQGLSAGPVGWGALGLVGTRDGQVLGFAGSETPELEVQVGDAPVHGLAAVGSRWFAACGQTAVVAHDGPAAAWARADLPRAAARQLVGCEHAVFAISGMRDAYDDEVPLLIALDPSDGRELLRRPLPRPAIWRVGGDALALVAGSGRTALVFCVYPGERTDPRAARLTRLRLAAADALSEGQLEVSAVVARAFVAAQGGYDVLRDDELAFVARTLARSQRPDEAEDVLFFAEAQAQVAELERWTALREELGLLTPLADAPPGDGEGPAVEDPQGDGKAPAAGDDEGAEEDGAQEEDQ